MLQERLEVELLIKVLLAALMVMMLAVHLLRQVVVGQVQ
jgi:hypothetical protein